MNIEPPLADQTVTVLEPDKGWMTLNLADVWRYRDLLILLGWRDISARYRQSIVGYGWAIIKPLISVVLFTFIFGRIAGIDTNGIPYPLFSITGLLPWMFFATALTSASGSVVGGGPMLQKVYFPRLILPLSSLLVGLADLTIQMLAIPVMLIAYQISPGPQLLLLPCFILLTTITALAVGLWTTALNVKYRDIGQALPFIIQSWMWICPVAYPSSAIPEKYRLIYGLNPLVGAIEGFRWTLLNSTPPDWTMMAVSSSTVLLLLTSGLFYFRRTESTFADII